LNWNGLKRTAQCIQSLVESNYPPFRILVVDNGSTDDSAAALSRAYPWLTVLQTHKNLGFAAGNNEGIKQALQNGADYIWLLNNDTQVMENALGSMLRVAEDDPQVGAVGSILLESPNTQKIQAWGSGAINLWTGLARQHTKRVIERKIDYVIGASVFLRSAALKDTGLLDEGYFLYWEDADLCFRMRAKGWKLAVAEGAFVIHEGNASSRTLGPLWDQYFTVSAKRFFRRYAPVPIFPIIIGALVRTLIRLKQGELGRVSAVWRGFGRKKPA